MSDFNAMHIIEALRSGIPSRTVGEYFTEARPGMMRKINDRLDRILETGKSDGMIFTGRYGEGKTHLLNTVFNRASAANMVVSMISIGIAVIESEKGIEGIEGIESIEGIAAIIAGREFVGCFTILSGISSIASVVSISPASAINGAAGLSRVSMEPMRKAGTISATTTEAAALQRRKAGQRGAVCCCDTAAYRTVSSRTRRGASS